MTNTTSRCQHCDGTGVITTMAPAPIKGSTLRSAVHLAPQNTRCPHCSWGRVTVEIEAEPVETPATAPITYCGQPVNAPGFDQDQFTRAMARAFCEDLQITAYHHGRHLVGCRNVYAYLVTRERCTCKAGVADMGCKHRAALIAHLDIREPHVRREWAQLNRERPIRKAVAS